MPQIPDESIDFICADLPFGTTACPWDSVIPFEPLWAEYKRIIKPTGGDSTIRTTAFYLGVDNVEYRDV